MRPIAEADPEGLSPSWHLRGGPIIDLQMTCDTVLRGKVADPSCGVCVLCFLINYIALWLAASRAVWLRNRRQCWHNHMRDLHTCSGYEEVQRCSKRWFLGCMNSRPWSRGSHAPRLDLSENFCMSSQTHLCPFLFVPYFDQIGSVGGTIWHSPRVWHLVVHPHNLAARQGSEILFAHHWGEGNHEEKDA